MHSTEDGYDSSYPRPQLVREEWVDLCGEWEFRYDDDDVGLTEHWPSGSQPFDRVIVVPFPPESALSGIGDTTHHPVVWYRRTFTAPTGERTLLHFGAVDYRASVWVDGALAVTHEGGHTPFSADITDVLRQRRGTGTADAREAALHTVVVRAEDRPTDATQPRGKQDWRVEPHSIWYHRTTGIWQPVWLEPVPDLHLADLAWTPDPATGMVRLDVELNRYPVRAASVQVTLSLNGEVLAEQSWRVAGDRAALDIGVPALLQGQDRQRLLWTPEQPNLVQAVVTVVDADRSAADTVQSYLGLRSAGVQMGHFLLNGEPYFPRMVLSQGYWPESHLAAPGDDALRREVELIKDFGFNGVRVHQKLEDPRFLYWCDVLGLLVWGEMANAYEFGTVAVQRLVQEWTEAVRRDRSHPCVVTWVPLNESWGVQDIGVDARQQHYATALYHLTHALDGSRPVISNDGWQHTESDILSIHDYAATGDELAERYGTAAAVDGELRSMGATRRRLLLGEVVRGDRPVMITEFGGLSYVPDEGEKWFGYAAVADQPELVSRLAGMIGALLDSSEVAGFCYTQLADTEQESNGLLTADRRPKLDPAVLRRVIAAPAKSLPAERVDLERAMAESQGRYDAAIVGVNGSRDGVVDTTRN
ncbi:glycoside hydrolase family 2 protein [Nakamurella sp. GG22]